MISNDRKKYKSAAEWLAALRQDELWHNRKERLQAVDSSKLASIKSKSIEELGNGVLFSFWEDYNHDVEKVIQEGWDTGMSLVNLKRDALNILTLEWLEKQKGDSHDVPQILKTDEAKKYWLRLEKAEFVDAKHALMPETTRKQAMYIAELFAEKLGINSKWKTFEQLWGISKLAQQKWDMQAIGSTPSRSKEIDKIFED